MPRTTNLDTSKPGVWVDQIRHPYTCAFSPTERPEDSERQLAAGCARNPRPRRFGQESRFSSRLTTRSSWPSPCIIMTNTGVECIKARHITDVPLRFGARLCESGCQDCCIDRPAAATALQEVVQGRLPGLLVWMVTHNFPLLSCK